MGEFDLNRFIKAQAPVYNAALAELKAGRKSTHWMWYIFPQLKGLGKSSTAEFYAIKSIAEARAYFDHPLLGCRLAECTDAVLNVNGRSLNEIFGSPDDMKFKSSMTLFIQALPDQSTLFREALDKYCGGVMDEKTIELLKI